MSDEPKRTAVITGGRDYTPTDAEMCELLIVLKRRDIELVVTGGARGVDTFVHDFMRGAEVGRGYYTLVVHADWEKHGRRAGPVRNREMLTRPGVRQLIAFKGGRGTWDCIQQAKRLGIDVHVIGEGRW